MELNREQIIKAIEYCFGDKPCSQCEWHEKGNGCLAKLEQTALALIKELTEENERLRGCVMSEEQVRNIANETIQQGIFIIKADTVRKMQAEIEARCIKGGIYPAFVKSTIDQIAEEMIGEKND